MSVWPENILIKINPETSEISDITLINMGKVFNITDNTKYGLFWTNYDKNLEYYLDGSSYKNLDQNEIFEKGRNWEKIDLAFIEKLQSTPHYIVPAPKKDLINSQSSMRGGKDVLTDL